MYTESNKHSKPHSVLNMRHATQLFTPIDATNRQITVHKDSSGILFQKVASKIPDKAPCSGHFTEYGTKCGISLRQAYGLYVLKSKKCYRFLRIFPAANSQ